MTSGASARRVLDLVAVGAVGLIFLSACGRGASSADTGASEGGAASKDVSTVQPAWVKARSTAECAVPPPWDGAEAWSGLRFGMDPKEASTALSEQGIEPGGLTDESIKGERFISLDPHTQEGGEVHATFDPCFGLDRFIMEYVISGNEQISQEMEKDLRSRYRGVSSIENSVERRWGSSPGWDYFSFGLNEWEGGYRTWDRWRQGREGARQIPGLPGAKGRGRLTWELGIDEVRRVVRRDGLPLPEERISVPETSGGTVLDFLQGCCVPIGGHPDEKEFGFHHDGCDWILTFSDDGLYLVESSCVPTADREKARSRVDALNRELGEAPDVTVRWSMKFEDDFTDAEMTMTVRWKDGTTDRRLILSIEPR